MLTLQHIIDALDDQLLDLNYEYDSKELDLKASGEQGFDVLLLFDPRESMICFGDGGYHEHFRHEQGNFDQLISLLVASLTGQLRIIEFSHGGKVKRFHLQEKQENEEWAAISQMGFPSWKFWKKPVTYDIKIFQNEYRFKREA